MNKLFEFADESVWSDWRLRERAERLGRHVLMLPEGGVRHVQVSREIEHINFETSARVTIAEIPLVGVQ